MFNRFRNLLSKRDTWKSYSKRLGHLSEDPMAATCSQWFYRHLEFPIWQRILSITGDSRAYFNVQTSCCSNFLNVWNWFYWISCPSKDTQFWSLLYKTHKIIKKKAEKYRSISLLNYLKKCCFHYKRSVRLWFVKPTSSVKWASNKRDIKRSINKD